MRGHHHSRTAVAVLRRLEWLHLDPSTRSLLPEGAGRWAIQMLPGGARRWFRHQLWSSRWWRRLYLWGEDRFFPSLTLHLGVRKRFIHDQVEHSWQRGVRQLVQVGAGLDSLCLRVSAQQREALCVEVDHPRTSELKREVLSELLDSMPRLQWVALDLRAESLSVALRVTSHDPYQPSVFVLEGVLMYLPADIVEPLLSDLRRIAAPGSRLLFTFMELDDGAPPRRPPAFRCSRFVSMYLAAVGEPFRWGLERRHLHEFLSRTGWHLEQCPHYDVLSKRYLVPLGLDRRQLPTFERFVEARPAAVIGGR